MSPKPGFDSALRATLGVIVTPTAPTYYTPYYCEENAWRLLQDPLLEGNDPHALFISNARRAFAMWQQRAAKPPHEPVLWDYHVVALARRVAWEVWDLDTQLPFPTEADRYLSESFPLHDEMKVELQPRFRLVPKDGLLARFASDRSHMRTADGAWRAEPPTLPAIGTAKETMNLWSWVDTEAAFVGEVFDLSGLRNRLRVGFG